MAKPLPKVEAANALSDEAYQARFLPDLVKRAADTGFHFDFASSTTLVEREKVTGKETSDLEACFQLLKSTSMDDYKAASMGWNTNNKRKEMRLLDMRYVLVRESKEGGAVLGFISFMITYEDDFEVVYIYEVHLAEALRGKGIGARLVKMVEELGRWAELSKVMLTVFTRNQGAYRFYQRLEYSIDEFSPEPRKLRNGVIKQPDYHILSKTLV